MRCGHTQLWRRIEFYVERAPALGRFKFVRIVGIDVTSLQYGLDYVSVVHNFAQKRLLLATGGHEHRTMLDFAEDLYAHGGIPNTLRHEGIDMRATYGKHAGLAPPNAAITYGGSRMIALAIQAMGEVRTEGPHAESKQVAAAPRGANPQARRKLWQGIRRARRAGTPRSSMRCIGCSVQRSRVRGRGGCAWRCARSARERGSSTAPTELPSTSAAGLAGWERRRRLEPFEKLAATVQNKFDAGVHGMLDHRSDAFVESMKDPMQRPKRTVRGYRTRHNFIAVACLWLSRLNHLPAHLLTVASVR